MLEIETTLDVKILASDSGDEIISIEIDGTDKNGKPFCCDEFDPDLLPPSLIKELLESIQEHYADEIEAYIEENAAAEAEDRQYDEWKDRQMEKEWAKV